MNNVGLLFISLAVVGYCGKTYMIIIYKNNKKCKHSNTDFNVYYDDVGHSV